MGTQPRGLQHNHEGLTCPFCNTGERELPHHVLFRCKAAKYNDIRALHWNRILSKMPMAMKESVRLMNEVDKTKYVLSCLGGSFVSEWTPLFGEVAIFVSRMYIARDSMYREPD